MEIKLNLIPPERKEEIAKKRYLKLVLRLEIVLTVILMIFLVIMWSYGYILKLSLSSQSLTNQESEKILQYEKIKSYEEKFNEVNSQISKIKTIKNDQLYWSILFAKLDKLVLSGINIKTLSTNDYAVTISGISNIRDDLIIFKEKLEEEDCFFNVDLPLSNLVDKNNIEFKIYFSINKDCLKKR